MDGVLGQMVNYGMNPRYDWYFGLGNSQQSQQMANSALDQSMSQTKSEYGKKSEQREWERQFVADQKVLTDELTRNSRYSSRICSYAVGAVTAFLMYALVASYWIAY